MSRSMEYRFSTDTIAERVSLTPKRDGTLTLAFLTSSSSSYRAIFQINLVSQDNEREMLWIARTGLDQELVSPRVKVLECVWSCRIEDENAAVSAAIESNSKRLEALLPSCVPNLNKLSQRMFVIRKRKWLTCIVTTRSSTTTSFVKKSAPMVALYWLEKRLLTYWFISDVLPTDESPRIITFKRTFFLDAIFIGISAKIYEELVEIITTSENIIVIHRRCSRTQTTTLDIWSFPIYAYQLLLWNLDD